MTWSFFTLQFKGAVGFGPCSFHPRAHHIYQGTNSEPQNRTRRRWLDRTGSARQWESASANTICILLGARLFALQLVYTTLDIEIVLSIWVDTVYAFDVFLGSNHLTAKQQVKIHPAQKKKRCKSEFLDISTWHNMTAFNTPQIIL